MGQEISEPLVSIRGLGTRYLDNSPSVHIAANLLEAQQGYGFRLSEIFLW
jgi:hypothetical protein